MVSSFTVRTPEDLLAVIPSLLGFHPHDSVVLVIIRDGVIDVVARMDISTIGEPGEAQRAVSQTLRNQRDDPSLRVCLVVYSCLESGRQAADLIGGFLGDMVESVILVDQGRWWRRDDPCEDGGRPLRESSGIVPSLRAHGRVAANREMLASSIAPPTGPKEDGLLNQVIEAVDMVDDLPRAAGRRVLEIIASFREGEVLSDKEFLAAGFAMSSTEARDVVWETLNRGNAHEYLNFWLEQLRRCPVGLRTIPLAVTGMVSWVAGEGALLNICLEEAMGSDPDYPLVATLRQISCSGVPPMLWDQMSSEPRKESIAV